MKKWFALILAAVMVVGCLAGCSGEELGATEPDTEPVQTEATEPEATEPEIVEPEIKTVSQGYLIRQLYRRAVTAADFEDLDGAIAWAAENEIIADGSSFDPAEELTNGAMAAILYRYAEAQGIVRGSDILENLASWCWDEGDIAEADREAVSWAIGSGIMRTYLRCFQPEAPISEYEYRVAIMRLSSLTKAVKEEQQAALEPVETEPEETDPEATDSENEENSGSTSGNQGGSTSGNSGSAGNNQSSGGSSGGSSNQGSTTEPPVEETAPSHKSYDLAAAAAAGNAYLSSLGANIDYSLGFSNASHPFSGDYEVSYFDSCADSQGTLNQYVVNYAAFMVDYLRGVSETNGYEFHLSDYSVNCYVEYYDFTGQNGEMYFSIFCFYG